MKIHYLLFSLIFLDLAGFNTQGQSGEFKTIAFYRAEYDTAHISFVDEVNRWFPEMAARCHFTYDSTNDWENLNGLFLDQYRVVIFLDARPEDPPQWEALKEYMEEGGAWMGFHFSGFTLTPSAFNQDWDWYHEEFLGSGPKLSEIWLEGDYPVVWTNKNYRMLYINMSHYRIDYAHKNNQELSFTFDNPIQNQLIIDGWI